jgi:hypothetical protein
MSRVEFENVLCLREENRNCPTDTRHTNWVKFIAVDSEPFPFEILVKLEHVHIDSQVRQPGDFGRLVLNGSEIKTAAERAAARQKVIDAQVIKAREEERKLLEAKQRLIDAQNRVKEAEADAARRRAEAENKPAPEELDAAQKRFSLIEVD